MKSSTAMLLLAIVTARLSPTLSAQSEGPQPGHWSCESGTETNPVYVTPVWDATASGEEVQAAFAELLFTKYGFKGRVNCPMAYMQGSTLAGLQASQQNVHAQYEKQGKKIVATGWTFVPEKASLAWSCYGFIGAQQEGKQVYYLYVTQLFRTPGSMKEALTTAWRAKLRELHPGYYPNPEGCQLLPPDPADRPARITQLAQQFKAQNPQIVHLDWAYHAESVAAANADTLPGYYCQMISADTKTWYVSPVNRLEGVYNGPAYYTSWNAFIKTVPGFNPAMFHGGCESGPMKNEREGRGSRKEQIGGQAGGKVYEVDWRYTPGASLAASSVAASAPAPAAAAAHAAPAPAASAPAAAAAPIRAAAPAAPPAASHPFYCRYLPRPEAVNAHQTMYQTDVFTYAGTITAVSQGWQKHVEETYHTQEKGRAPCLMLPPTPEQQQQLVKSLDRAMESSRISVVKDGWRP